MSRMAFVALSTFVLTVACNPKEKAPYPAHITPFAGSSAGPSGPQGASPEGQSAKPDVRSTLERLTNVAQVLNPLLPQMGLDAALFDNMTAMVQASLTSPDLLDKLNAFVNSQETTNPVGLGILELMKGILAGKSMNDTGETALASIASQPPEQILATLVEYFKPK